MTNNKATPSLQFNITDEQLAIVLDGETTPQVSDANEPVVVFKWALHPTETEVVGLHLRATQSMVTLRSKQGSLKDFQIIRAGYENIQNLWPELEKWRDKSNLDKANTVVTVSGKASPFVVAKAPSLSRSMLEKTLTIQLKQVAKEESDNYGYVPISPIPSDKNAVTTYLVTSVTPSVMKSTLEGLRRLKFKVVAWDSELLCYARSLMLLWQGQKIPERVCCGIIMGWNRCRIIMVDASGKLVASLLPIGIAPFWDEIKLALNDPKLDPKWLEESALYLQCEDSIEDMKRKCLVNQVVANLYIPMIQSFRMEVFSLCQENGLEVPQHFSIMGPGSRLFRLSSHLAKDMGMKLVAFDAKTPPEVAASYGATFWDSSELHLNAMPRDKSEALYRMKEVWETLRSKSKKTSAGNKSPLASLHLPGQGLMKYAVMAAVFLGLLAIYPVWERISVSASLDERKAEVARLMPEREKFEEFTRRQALVDKRVNLKKKLDKAKIAFVPILKEILFSLPPTIRLSSLSIQETRVSLKGVAVRQEDLESFLEVAAGLRMVTDPTPLNLRSEAGFTSFELLFKPRVSNDS